jgi:hypothetical protein
MYIHIFLINYCQILTFTLMLIVDNKTKLIIVALSKEKICICIIGYE